MGGAPIFTTQLWPVVLYLPLLVVHHDPAPQLFLARLPTVRLRLGNFFFGAPSLAPVATTQPWPVVLIIPLLVVPVDPIPQLLQVMLPTVRFRLGNFFSGAPSL